MQTSIGAIFINFRFLGIHYPKCCRHPSPQPLGPPAPTIAVATPRAASANGSCHRPPPQPLGPPAPTEAAACIDRSSWAAANLRSPLSSPPPSEGTPLTTPFHLPSSAVLAAGSWGEKKRRAGASLLPPTTARRPLPAWMRRCASSGRSHREVRCRQGRPDPIWPRRGQIRRRGRWIRNQRGRIRRTDRPAATSCDLPPPRNPGVPRRRASSWGERPAAAVLAAIQHCRSTSRSGGGEAKGRRREGAAVEDFRRLCRP
uniref:Uncharacterized protein n=1 Tax=Oryza sativa subsp. japonica TaxID=39947 RepID=Q6YWL4_ORYSJ|nr:hypothetical protein [Oryza sativa Japonica Group]BAD10617.1 hypothetical protein [Oryza sativa Japonica Group]